MHLLQPAVQLSRQPPHNHWCSGDGGHCRKGAILWLSETDGRCRQKCRSPSPRETSHRSLGWAPGWEFGTTTQSNPRCPHRPVPKRAHMNTLKLHPKAFSQDSQHHLLSPYLLSQRTDTPPSATSAGQEGAGGPTPLLLPWDSQGRAWHARVAGKVRGAQRRA